MRVIYYGFITKRRVRKDQVEFAMANIGKCFCVVPFSWEIKRIRVEDVC